MGFINLTHQSRFTCHLLNRWGLFSARARLPPQYGFENGSQNVLYSGLCGH